MDAKLIIGGSLQAVSKKLADAIKPLPHGKVETLAKQLSREVQAFLPVAARGKQLSGLKLDVTGTKIQAHKGWLFSRYLDACSELGVDAEASVGICSDGLFYSFGKRFAEEGTFLLIGIADSGARMLQAILEAERIYDPDRFDADGYLSSPFASDSCQSSCK